MQSMSINGLLFVLFASFTTSALASDDPGLTAEKLRHMTQEQLDDLYLDAEPGKMPDGASNGTAVFFPGEGALNYKTQMLAALVWQGKVFDRDKDILLNRVFGFKAIKAKIYYGESLMDGGESIIIDYSKTSILARKIRDEIREVSPNLYLGRAYYRSWLFGDLMVVNFILDFN